MYSIHPCIVLPELLDGKDDRTFKIKDCWTKNMTGLLKTNIKAGSLLPDEKHDRTFGIKVREVLPDEKHNQTFGIKIRKVLPDEKHNQTFGIKCCQTKSMTGLLELSVARRKA
ncbi:hypothetical protein RclHR1_05880011 [Rhizophagus clarus]|uniref:Uncharacterized protein n=1 Tax=Rhizophagus clarus TaxID=94130 RepID=A0A2Z6RP32_9GLOM|nr:hypothetical protein RclHR1_05880011 [Rhizophagus clarus]